MGKGAPEVNRDCGVAECRTLFQIEGMINLHEGQVRSELKVYVSFELLVSRRLTLVGELSGQGRRNGLDMSS